MSEQHYVRCDGCGRTLHLPTTKQASEGWELLSRSYDGRLYKLHWCGQCTHREDLVRRLEGKP